jgi:hypothetical protein
MNVGIGGDIFTIVVYHKRVPDRWNVERTGHNGQKNGQDDIRVPASEP